MPEHTNKSQALAIEKAFGPVQVLAGPGSGKTYLTIRRIRHLICHHGISPNKILVITFTKAAAKEMEQRFLALTNGLYKEVRFGTFHAVYYQILSQSGYSKKNISLASSADTNRYLLHCLKMQGVSEADTDHELAGELLKRISARKNECYGGEKQDGELPLKNMEKMKQKDKQEYIRKINGEREIEIGEYGKIIDLDELYKEYCLLMKEENKLDFDDMILLCDKMLEDNKSILSFWQQSFSHILVDEFQDIGKLQYRVIKRLAQPENNLFVVGDDDQSIYGFRGAGPDIMKNFMSDYAHGLQITLDTNYRCTGNIVKASSLLISDNRNRFAKQMKAVREDGEKVSISSFSTREEEYSYLSKRLKAFSSLELANTAVIFRSNAQVMAMAKVLRKEKVPFYKKSQSNHIFESDIAMDILAYIRFANDYYYTKKKMGARKDMLRIMNKPCRYIHRNALENEYITKQDIMSYYKDKPYMQQTIIKFFEDMERIASLRPYLAVNYIRKVIGYDKYRQETPEKTDEIQNTADQVQGTASEFQRLEDWLAYISAYSQNITDTESKYDKRVKLITMHGSKGLEYDYVFVPDINKANLPGRKAVTQELVEEERRLFYVAMTRAKKKLEILYYGEPSSFLHKLACTSLAGTTI